MSQTHISETPSARPRRRGLFLRIAGGVMLAIVLIGLAGYVRLLAGPVSLDMFSERVQKLVADVIDDSFSVEWEGFGIALDGPLNPVLRLSSVQMEEVGTAAAIKMTALEIGVSPLGLLSGQPDARITLIEPHFQMVQDLLGPRLSLFALLEDGDTGEITAQISEGASVAPTVRIRQDGLQLTGHERNGAPGELRSDNDWLIYNFEAMNKMLGELSGQALGGQVARIAVRDGSVGMLDTVYGRYKEFERLSVEVRATGHQRRISAIFETEIAGRMTHGVLSWHESDEAVHLEASLDAIDFATIIPFLDDPDGLVALRGAGSLDLAVRFNADTGVIEDGVFTLDLTGTQLRLNNDVFDVATEPFEVIWHPTQSLYSFADVHLHAGQSRATISGDLGMGFDNQFGPTIGISIRANEVYLQPDDLDAPNEPLEFVTFEGWSAPLYGAVGIDRMVAARDAASVVLHGRIDAVREGVGIDLRVSGRGATADDLKRLWPYLFAPEAREWFVEYVRDGYVHSADLHVNLPVGSIDLDGADAPIPDGGLTIDLVGSAVQLQPLEGLPRFEVDGETRVTVRDNRLTMAFERAVVPDDAGDITITNAAFLNQDTSAREQVFEISGDISGDVSSLVNVANREPLNLLENFEIDYDIDALALDLEGVVNTTVIATIAMDDIGRMVGTDYVLNGAVSRLRSRRPIEGLNFSDANLSFTASQEGFRLTGGGRVEDVALDIQATSVQNGQPDIRVAANLGVAQAQALGIDLSEFLSGDIRVVASPRADGRFALSADMSAASLTLADIGIHKPAGVSGAVNGIVGFSDDRITVSDIDLGFGNVRLGGDIAVSAGGELLEADFSTFQISSGDDAQVSIQPVPGGFALDVRGRQLDLKPILKRFFDLEGDDVAGASPDLQNQRFDVRVQLDRAVGYFGTVAIGLNLDLSVRGDELLNVNLSAQLGGGRAVSATTNTVSNGRVITYASNDLGAILRFTGIYPRLVGGEGTLVMRYNASSQTENGEFVIRDFSIVDEVNVAQIVASHSESRQLIARGNALNFDYGRAKFVRRADRIEVTEAMLNGESVGGTLRGNILTGDGRYDLAGTYIPLFGLNNIFQQIPLLGPIFGGRDGEGLIGVTFAIRGPLSDPDILINPASILAPGMFRSLFEYRSTRQDG